MNNLTKEEKEILESIERGGWKNIQNFDEEKRDAMASARAMLRKNKRVNIRISKYDLDNLQKRAFDEGIPYQTLMSSVLHKYAHGRLKTA